MDAVKLFLHLAADKNDPLAARALMTAESNTIPAFDPQGLAGKRYAIGEPVVDEDAVIIPVSFSDSTGLMAQMPIVVILENETAKLDIASTMELMLGAEVNYVDGISEEDLTK